MSNTYKTEGVVLKVLKYSESSVIVEIYTKERGLRKFIVSGLSSSKNLGKASCYRHLNILDLVAYDKQGGLARVKEQRLAYHYQTLPYDVAKSSIGLFALELFQKAVKEAEANERLYRYLSEFLQDLDCKTGGLGGLPIRFMLDLAQHIGIVPINNRSERAPYLDMLEGGYVETISENTLDSANSLVVSEMLSETQHQGQISRESKVVIVDWLLKYYQVHLNQFRDLKSVGVLREIF